MLKGKLNRNPAIVLIDKHIQFVRYQPYLGVVLERNLTFYNHIKTTGAKAKTLLGKITRVIRLKYGIKLAQLNFLYKTVFAPIISYGAWVFQHRLNHCHTRGLLRSIQRKVLLNITGAYCTTSLLALCTVTNNLPMEIKLTQDVEVCEARRKIKSGQPNLEKPADIKRRHQKLWQEEWSAADTGRHTYNIL